MSAEETRSLEREFDRNGFSYRQIWRKNDVAVFEYFTAERLAQNLVRYELIFVGFDIARTLPSGRTYPQRETYPSSTAWGQAGWSFGPKDRNLALFIAEQIAEVPKSGRIEKIHQFMDRWKFYRNRADQLRNSGTPF